MPLMRDLQVWGSRPLIRQFSGFLNKLTQQDQLEAYGVIMKFASRRSKGVKTEEHMAIECTNIELDYFAPS